MTTRRRIFKWLALSFGCLVACYALVIAGIAFLDVYMGEGVLERETLEGNVLVALSDNPSVRQALISGCQSTGSLPVSVSTLLASGLLAEVPSGTKMNMTSMGGDSEVGTTTVSEGRLKGRQVWACRGQFALLHSWF